MFEIGREVNRSDIHKGVGKLIEEPAKDLDPAPREAVTGVHEN